MNRLFDTTFRGLRGWLGLAMAMAALTLAGCNKQPQGPQGKMAAVVAAAPVTVQDVPYYLDEIGHTTADQVVTIAPQVAGKLLAVNFRNGDDVRRGELLYEIDPRPFQAQLDAAESLLLEARARLTLAREQLDRAVNLQKTPGAVSDEELQNRQSAVDVGLADVQSALANAETARLNLEYCKVLSPVDGRAGQSLVDAGNVVKVNDTQLVVIQSFTPIWADFTVTEEELPRVRQYYRIDRVEFPLDLRWPGTCIVLPRVSINQRAVAAATATTQPSTRPAHGRGRHGVAKAMLDWFSQYYGQPNVEVRSPDDASKVRVGKLQFLDNTIQSGTGTIKLRARLDNQDRLFWPGQFVRVRLVLATRHNATLVPSQSVQHSQQGAFVYVVAPNPDAKTNKEMPTIAKMRPVTVGQRQGDMIVVEEGLAAGDVVVTEYNQMMLAPDMPVMVKGAGKS